MKLVMEVAWTEEAINTILMLYTSLQLTISQVVITHTSVFNPLLSFLSIHIVLPASVTLPWRESHKLFPN